MDNDRATLHNFEQEKSLERKRKAAYLESIFENGAKSPSKDGVDVKDGLSCKDSPKFNGCLSVNGSGGVEGNSTAAKRSMANSATPSPAPSACHHKDQDSKSDTSNIERVNLNHTNAEAVKPRETPCVTKDTNHYTGLNTAGGVRRPMRDADREKSAEFDSAMVVKQEQGQEHDSGSESLPVQIVSVQGSQEKKVMQANADNGEIGDDYIKFLLFAGRLYRCAKVSNLSHNVVRFEPESMQGRKGKVVVLLLFHKTYREVVSYVVGVVEHTTLNEQTIMMKIIKSQTYPATLTPSKGSESKELKFTVGSKKLLYNMQTLDGPVYGELVKILDGFGANSSVDHSKISEFNAMINANADRFDGQVSSYPGTLAFSFARTSTGPFVSPPFTYLGNRVSKNHVRYSPLGTRPSRDNSYSPGPLHAGPQGSLHERRRSCGSRGDVDNDLPRQTYGSHGGSLKGDHVVYTVASRTARISPGTYNSHVNLEHSRNATPIPASVSFHSAREEKSIQEGAICSPRRNVQDLQTVAELCKEKMKRDMAEQELKSIKAAFEEFKSQMQHHLSQVEERMVLLEAENRTLKGKLSNMHQTNGYAEKKYHELRGRLEDVLKSV